MSRYHTGYANKAPTQTITADAYEDHLQQKHNDMIRTYHWFMDLRRHRDGGVQALGEFFEGRAMVSSEAMRTMQLDLVEDRECYWCGAVYQRAKSVTTHECKFHPGGLDGTNRFTCCGRYSKSEYRYEPDSHTPTRIDIGCTPCSHMSLGTYDTNRTVVSGDIDPISHTPVRDVFRVPLVLLFSGVVQWPHPSLVTGIEYKEIVVQDSNMRKGRSDAQRQRRVKTLENTFILVRTHQH